MKPRTLTLYVLTVDALAVAAVIASPSGGVWDRIGTVLMLSALAGLVGSRPVRIPALRTEVTAGDAFALCAMSAFGPAAGALVSLGGVLGAALGRRCPTAWIRLAFNLGAVPLSMMVASWGFLAAGGTPGGSLPGIALPLAWATTLYFLVNTGLVTGAIAIEKQQRFWPIWKGSFLWTALAAFAGLSLAAVLIELLRLVGPWGFVLGVPPCWLLVTFYRTNKEHIEKQDERVETVEEINAELEQKVAERTHKLQEVLARVEAMNRELRETNERLVEASRIKSEFLANVSHELRTPLNAVIGFSELLSDPSCGALTEQQREFLSDIRDSGEHLLHLINNILDLSKVEAGRLEAHLQNLDLHEEVREAVAMLRPQAGKKNLRLSVTCPAALPAGRVDPGMFREVLANLLSNAVKFTPPGGTVEVEARSEGSDLVVEVRDTGIGIAPEDQGRIFDQFYQVDGSYSRKYQGTGLGLALVLRMVKLHGGTVSVRSAPGQGSCFTCRFPGCLLEIPSSDLPREASPAPGVERMGSCLVPVASRRTILVVEDNPLNRKLARNALRSHGFQVLEAVSGEQALELLRRERPDLVLMDLQLPGMDGLEVTKRLKADPETANLQVVALTAHTQRVDEERARSAGCVGYIAKPIRLTQFPGQIEAYLVQKEGVA